MFMPSGTILKTLQKKSICIFVKKGYFLLVKLLKKRIHLFVIGKAFIIDFSAAFLLKSRIAYQN